MTRQLPHASIATPTENGKLSAPSALRNLASIVDLLRSTAPASGRVLEIASGTGQHITALASALPDLHWHPTEIATDRIASINAYAEEAGLGNLHPAQILDAAQVGWATQHRPYDLIYMGNILHLIPMAAAATILSEAANALAPKGRFVIYGPFMRAGALTSDGDQTFHNQLQRADPAVGYKDDIWVKQILTQAGLSAIVAQDMPANNLAFIAQQEPS
ncbi:MAG: DUF938 domain-containing protein [Sulfitobacter sp.]